MSRIGKQVIELPEKVKIEVSETGKVTVEGPKGKLEWILPENIKLEIEEKKIQLTRSNDSRQTKALHGLARSLVNNMVQGVSQGFIKDLEIQGVGFKAALQGKTLNLSLGKSHPILYMVPNGLKITVTDNTKVRVEGIDRQLVGQAAADIRGFYPPEPYKGKGVRYANEQVVRKEGKTVQ